jgi:hypothetical protein
MFGAMFWPLIGAFIVFVLVAVFMGWLMDGDRKGGDAGKDSH